MTDRFQSQALSTRLGIPIIYGVDAVHGDGDVKGAVLFPHNIGLGATRNPDIVQKAARVTAREVAGTGARWAFAPCIAVARDERWGRTYESYGESPELAELLGPAAVRGFQDAPDSEAGTAVLASRQALPRRRRHLRRQGPGGHAHHRGGAAQDPPARLHRLHQGRRRQRDGLVLELERAPMHGNKALITDVLKGELGFTGFVVTDWAAIDKMSNDYKQDVEVAINAGIDMVMVPIRYREFVADMKELVAAGRIPMARIDDAVRRILKQKVRFKLWERPFTDRALTAQIGSAEHRAVARQAVQQSLVVLKNDKNVLPLAEQRARALCGFRADDMGVQCGGWSVGWRGHRGAITPGTTIRQGFEQVLGAGRVDFSKDAAGAEKADVVVVVVGEDPYAEGSGDRAKLELGAEDRALIDAAKRSGKPLVIVLLSGRPLDPGRHRRQRQRAGGGLAAGDRGRRDRRRARPARSSRPASSPAAGRARWRRSRSTSAIRSYAPLFEYGFGL